MLNKELLIIAVVIILGLFAVVLVQNFNLIENHHFNSDMTGISDDVSYHSSNTRASSQTR